MAKLSIYLPPFASDYTGICSALFDADCLTVIADAKCCTSHVVYWDEPRWSQRPRPTLSAQLRSLDIVLGQDSHLLHSILEMDHALAPASIALVGTPVPAITGMDLDGLAFQLEDLCGKPVFAFPTSGFASYDQGLWQAGTTLVDRFCPSAARIIPRSLNLLGLSPLDHGAVGNDLALKAALLEAGWQVNASLFMGYSQKDLPLLPAAEHNLVLSAAGLRLAKELWRHFHTPYTVCFPMGQLHLDWLLRRLCHPDTPEPSPLPGDTSTLIVADQVMAHSLRQALRLSGCQGTISTATFFYSDRELEEREDVALRSEQDLLHLLRSHPYQHVVGDPMLAAIPEIETVHFHPLVHPAVSGKFHWAEVPRFLLEDFQLWLEHLAAQISYSGG